MQISRTRLRFAALLLTALSFVSSTTARADKASTPIAAALQPFVDSHILAGAVTLVADKDKVLDVTTVGYADVAAKKPMSADDLFWIASMSKPIKIGRASCRERV